MTLVDGRAFQEGHFCGREVAPYFEAALANSWLGMCSSKHECIPPLRSCPTRGPSRLVEIHGGPGAFTLRLISVSGQQKYHYAALSYRWSDKIKHRTLRNYVEGYESAIAMSSLPETIRDAMEIAFALGLRYVWVDCLCIIQDDLQDWDRECEKMSDIFANATVTLAASSARDASGGLLRKREPYPIADNCCLRFRDINNDPCDKVKVLYVKDLWNENVHTQPMRGQPLDQRGWTLQERLLSNRVLSFESDKMWWECSSFTMMESLHMPLTRTTSNLFLAKKQMLGLSANEVYDWWLKATSEYCKRRLTYPMDALPAIAGVANVVSQLTNDIYLAGLWQNDLARGLTWKRDPTSSLAEMPVRKVELPYRAPSWSWARSDIHAAQISCVPHNDNRVESLISLVAVDIKTDGANPFGRVLRECPLTIRAPVRSTQISKMQPHSNLSKCALGSHRTRSHNPELRVTLDDAVFADSFGDRAEEYSVLAVRIYDLFESSPYSRRSSYGLVLQVAGDGECCRRIGLFETQWPSEYVREPPVDVFFKNAEIRTITII